MSLDQGQRAGVTPPPSKLPLLLAALGAIVLIGIIAGFLVAMLVTRPVGNTASAAATPANAAAGRSELLPSGVRVEMIREGTGPLITRADAILLRYELQMPGRPLLDGNMDAAQGLGITLNMVGSGFAEGLGRMRPRGIARFWLTARQAYGDTLPQGAVFRPGDMLELLVQIEQVAPGRGAEVEASRAQAGNSIQSNAADAAPQSGRR